VFGEMAAHVLKIVMVMPTLRFQNIIISLPRLLYCQIVYSGPIETDVFFFILDMLSAFDPFAQAEIQRMRLELGRVAQERDSYKQKCDAIHRVNQQHGNHQQHQPQQQQQQQQQQSKSNRTAGSQINDGPTSYYL
jgi:hypothetical protein